MQAQPVSQPIWARPEPGARKPRFSREQIAAAALAIADAEGFAVLRSAGLEILGMGSGTMPPVDVLTGMLRELLDLLAAGGIRIDTEAVPLSAVGEVWGRDQQGRRPVFIP